MDISIMNLLNSPEFQQLITLFIAPLAVNSISDRLKALKAAIKDKTHEAQLLDCLEKAFFETERDCHWKHDTEAIYETFMGSLMSFSGSFNQDSLAKIFRDAVGADVTDRQIALWVDNVKKQISLEEHTKLREYLLVCHIMQDQTPQSESKPKHILTSSASIYDNPEIICRDAFIDDLLGLLSSGHNRIQITGMGGLGKTEVLKKVYAKLARAEEKSEFDHVAYIQFSGDISTDIEAQLDYPNPYKELKGINASNYWLHEICSHYNVLLCIDDIRLSMELVHADHSYMKYLDSLGATVLLASRVVFPGFEVKPLELLTTDACTEIFRKTYGRSIANQSDFEILKSIIENRAGNHTLVVSRLGSMAGEYEWSIPDLSKQLNEQNFYITTDIADDTAFQNEINKLYLVDEKLTEPEKIVLKAFSTFPTIPLSYDLCVDWVHEDARVDSNKCALILTKLSKKTWLIKQYDSDEHNPSCYMHPIVKIAVQSQLCKDKPFLPHLVDRITSTIFKLVDNYKLSCSSEIVPFAINVMHSVALELSSFFTLSCVIADYYFKTANYEAVEVWHRSTLSYMTDLLDSEHPFVAMAKNNLASALQLKGCYSEALTLYLESFAILDKQQVKDLHTIGTLASNIASIYFAQDELVLSLDWYNKCLSLNKQTNFTEKRSAAETFCSIGSIYHKKGEFSLAREYFEMSLSLFTELNLTSHASFAQLLNNFATLCLSERKEDEGLALLLKALAIRKEIFGPNHPDTASTYNNISAVYEQKGEYENALLWIHKAQEVCDTVCGHQHIHTATTYNNIGRILRKQGAYEQSLEWHKEALNIVENTSDKSPFMIGAICSNIADVYYDQTKYNDALNWYIRASTMLELSPRQDTQTKIHVNSRIKVTKRILSNSD